MELSETSFWQDLYRQFGHVRRQRRDAPDLWPHFLEKHHLFLDQCAHIIDTRRGEIIQARGFERVFGIPDEDVSVERLIDLYEPSQLELMRGITEYILDFVTRYGIRPREDSLLIYGNLKHADGRSIYIERRIFALDIAEDSRPLTLVNIYQKLDMQYFQDDIKVQLYVPYAEEMIDTWQDNLLKEEGLTLTKRERAVLMLLIRGAKSHEIADQLCLSKNTIDTYRRRLIRKANVKNTLELIRRYHNSPLNLMMK